MAIKVKAITPLLAMVALVGLGALGAYVTQSKPISVPDKPVVSESQDTKRENSASETQSQAEPKTDQVKNGPKVFQLRPVENGNDISFKREEVVVQEGQEPMAFAVESSLHLIPSVPASAHVTGIDVKGGTAVVQFNKAIEAGYGSEEEAAILNSIKQTLAQFKAVQRFQLEVEGKQIKTLGQFDLSEPVSINGLQTSDTKVEHP